MKKKLKPTRVTNDKNMYFWNIYNMYLRTTIPNLVMILWKARSSNVSPSQFSLVSKKQDF